MAKIVSVILFSTLLVTSAFAASSSTTEKLTPKAMPQTIEKVSVKLNPLLIEKLTNAKGQFDQQSQYKVAYPRNDLDIIVNGVKLSSAMGLTSWATFSESNNTTHVVGDLVLTEDQVNPVISVVLDNHLTVTALHNHFLWETPKLMFLHFDGKGDEKQLAIAVGKAFAKMKATEDGKGDLPTGIIDATNTTLNPQVIDTIIGIKPRLNNGVYTILADVKPKKANSGAVDVIASATFAGSNDAAVVDGNISMDEASLQKVLTILHQAGITIVALHQHESYQSSHFIYMHFWGVGKVDTLAKGLRSALTVSINNV